MPGLTARVMAVSTDKSVQENVLSAACRTRRTPRMIYFSAVTGIVNMAKWRRAFGGHTALGFLLIFLLHSASVGYAGTSDEKSAAAVDEVFGDLTKSGSPGCALGVYRDGKIVYAKGYGLATSKKMWRSRRNRCLTLALLRSNS